MDARDVLGTPILTVTLVSVTLAFAAAVGWMAYSIRHVTPELLQVQVFRKLKRLQNSILAMGLGLLLGMGLITLLLADVAMPVLLWAGAATAAAILFWYGIAGYSSVFRIPRTRPGRP